MTSEMDRQAICERISTWFEPVELLPIHLAKLLPKLILDGDCWIVSTVNVGYAKVRLVDGPTQTTQAHIAVYRYLVGPIQDGLTLDHKCRRKTCVNPQHLEPVTRGENVLRGVGISAMNAKKTHCNKGHAYDSTNTYIEPKTGDRRCKTCNRNQKQATYDPAKRRERRERENRRSNQ